MSALSAEDVIGLIDVLPDAVAPLLGASLMSLVICDTSHLAPHLAMLIRIELYCSVLNHIER